MIIIPSIKLAPNIKGINWFNGKSNGAYKGLCKVSQIRCIKKLNTKIYKFNFKT